MVKMDVTLAKKAIEEGYKSSVCKDHFLMTDLNKLSLD